MRFHHLGVATARLDRERSRYERLGYTASTDLIVDHGIGVTLQFLEHPTAPRIELVTGIEGAATSPVASWIDRKVHVYHHAFLVADLAAALDVPGTLVVAPPQPAVAFGGRLVAFVAFAPGMLVEYIEEEP